MGGNLDMNNNDIDSINNMNVIGNIEGNGSANINSFDQINANTKNFDIPHPTKPGWRLQYSSLEGPERGVYVRGKVGADGVINLPDYWTGLVYEDSITVQLTPIGKACAHYVINANRSQITVGCECGDVNAYYLVHGERQHNDPILVEYQAVK